MIEAVKCWDKQGEELEKRTKWKRHLVEAAQPVSELDQVSLQPSSQQLWKSGDFSLVLSTYILMKWHINQAKKFDYQWRLMIEQVSGPDYAEWWINDRFHFEGARSLRNW